MVKGRSRSRGPNVEVQVFFYDLGLVTLDDIDSCDVTNNDTLVTYQPLGAVEKGHDIEYGDYTIEIKFGKTGSDLSRLIKFVEETNIQALETPKGWLVITTQSRRGLGYEVVRYNDIVAQMKTVSNQQGNEVVQSVTFTASSRKFEQLIPPESN